MTHLTPKLALTALSISLLVASPFVVMPGLAKTVRASAAVSMELRSADQSLQTGHYDVAEKRYMAILQKSPNDIKARSSLAVAQAELYKLDAAEKNAKQVLSKDRNNAMAHTALGVVNRNRTASQDLAYRSLHDMYLAESARELELATHLDSRSPEAHTELGVTYRFQGRFDEAQQAFQRALQLDPNNAEAMVNQGIIRLQTGDTQGAKDIYNRAIRLNSHNHMAHYRLGEALLAEKDPHGAIKSLNTALSLDPGNAAIMTKLGESYEAQGNIAAAIAGYRKAMNVNPSFMPAYVGLSNLYDSRGDGEMAMAELKSALNVNPKFNPARNQLGRLALVVDKPDQAMQYYHEALNVNPHDPEALQGLSQALMTVAQKTATTGNITGNESDLVTAEQHVQEALKLNPNDLRLHLAMLRISQMAGKPAASAAEYQRIVAAPTNTATERMVKGEALLALGRYEEADQLFGDMMQSAGKNTDTLLQIGDTLKANNDLDGARRAYEKVAAMEPNNLKAQRGVQRIASAESDSEKSLRLAKALNNWFQRQSSIDFYEDALQKNPRQPEARLALSKLYERYKYYDKAVMSYQMYLGLMPDMSPRDRENIQKRITKLQVHAQKPSHQNGQLVQTTP
jgi:tetratricopeptide (TPR) repeat protein